MVGCSCGAQVSNFPRGRRVTFLLWKSFVKQGHEKLVVTQPEDNQKISTAGAAC